MKAQELRDKFLKFFEDRGHKVIPSASLVPENDPSVLFTTAGMQQFKRFYLFPDEAPAANIVTIQKCIRTGDIDEVGDESHLTFFEMLGNFSFGYPKKEGSYFKKEAIEMAWEFLTDEKWLGIAKNRISATYFDQKEAKSGISITVDTDVESKEILETLDGLKNIEPQGEDNFWSLGTLESPGGPTVEFYVDEIEVWNLVFNEAVFKGDHWHWDNVAKGVDTGMGFERLLAVLNKEKDVYKTELFWPIIEELQGISNMNYNEKQSNFRIIADHVRAIVFLIADGVTTGKKDRGSVLRKLIRDAQDNILDLYFKDPLIINKLSQVVVKKYCIDEAIQKRIAGILNEELGMKRIHHEANMPEINKRIRILERYINKELDYSEGADPKWLKAAFIDDKKDNESIAAGKFAYHLFNTHRVLKNKFWDLLDENVKVLINKEDFEKGYSLGQEKFKEISRAGAEKKFKGGLADDKEQTTKLHTAAHLLLASLKKVLSPDVEQKGANITEERLRFDFNWPEKLNDGQIKQVEDLVNSAIDQKLPVKMEEMPLEEAKKIAHGTFLDRYGDKVKVYTIGDLENPFSKEICGGPHVKNTSELGTFKIIKEESSSAGIRRIKAVLE